MRSSILMSLAISMLAFMGTAEANITPELSPGIPKTSAQAKAQGVSDKIYTDFTDAQTNCAANHSGNESAWRECLAAAEKDYLAAIGHVSPDESTVGATIPVSTNAADSNYEHLGSGHKGFKNAEE